MDKIDPAKFLPDPPVNRIIMPDPVRVSIEDRLATAKNVAVNGRLFCVLLVLISLVLFVVERDAYFATLATFAALPVGASCLLDQMPDRPIKYALMAILYLFTAIIPIAIFINIG